MKFTRPLLATPRNWNWDGDRICRDTIVSTLRWVPGRPAQETYPMDVRELLQTERNALMKAVRPDIERFGQELFASSGFDFSILDDRNPGAFDRRASVIHAYVEHKIRYSKTDADLWQFPDETVFLAEGDCEDRALLLAALLLSNDISPYCVRVVLGQIEVKKEDGSSQTHDHAWVMYKNETGRWLTMELEDRSQPILPIEGSHPDLPSLLDVKQVIYKPLYLFNGDHVWEVTGHGNRQGHKVNQPLARRWRGLHPLFFGSVHRSIVHTALDGVALPAVLSIMNRLYTNLFGQVVDAPDLNPFGYNPLDHFDNALVNESWDLVKQRLDAFRQRPIGDPEGTEAFAYAAHSIADFYAHTTYAHHAVAQCLPSGAYRPKDANDPQAFKVTNPIAIGEAPFSCNEHYWKGTPAEAQAHWKDRIVSGRYGQPGDSQGILEAPCFIPKHYIKNAEFQYRAALPHHNELAVDHEAANKLYPNPTDATNQYRWRFESACAHIKESYCSHPNAMNQPTWP